MKDYPEQTYTTEATAEALQGLLELMLELGALAPEASASSVDRNQTETNRTEHKIDKLDREMALDQNVTEPSGEAQIANPNIQPKTFISPAPIPSFQADRSQNIESNREAIANSAGDDLSIEELHQVLFGSDIERLKQKLQKLENQIHQPDQLIELMLPVITDILGSKVAQARTEMTNAIAPVIDQMIELKIVQDKPAMSDALAPVMPSAIAQNITDNPGEFAKAIAPEMGEAIQEQLRINTGAMIDALYPIIGSTISKYLSEAIRTINEKVENTLSIEGISRKIRAKLQGVSEAELILQESMPVIVRAIFLIHKDSGLVISEVQPSDPTLQILESEMVAGMLTAIRSFVNDCIAQSVSELNEIDYGSSKIMLEAAGHCYLAVVIEGERSQKLIARIRKTLGVIVENYGKAIAAFNGDPETVPAPIQSHLAKLADLSIKPTNQKSPPVFQILLVGIVGAIAIPWMIWQYRHSTEQKLKSELLETLASAPELGVYRFYLELKDNRLLLQGRVPTIHLRNLAQSLTTETLKHQGLENLTLDNQVIAVNIPTDPSVAAAEVQRVTTTLNQISGIKITTKYEAGKVTVTGQAIALTDAQKITKSLAQIPGVTTVINTTATSIPMITTRIYFDFNSTQVADPDLNKILQVKQTLEQYPSYDIQIIGHSDPTGDRLSNYQIALRRSQAVANILIKQGLPQQRLQTIAADPIKKDELDLQNLVLNRYVEFKLRSP